MFYNSEEFSLLRKYYRGYFEVKPTRREGKLQAPENLWGRFSNFCK